LRASGDVTQGGELVTKFQSIDGIGSDVNVTASTFKGISSDVAIFLRDSDDKSRLQSDIASIKSRSPWGATREGSSLKVPSGMSWALAPRGKKAIELLLKSSKIANFNRQDQFFSCTSTYRLSQIFKVNFSYLKEQNSKLFEEISLKLAV
jgi:hypothetical protein